MKANKFFAVALAALTLMACNKKDEPQQPLTITPATAEVSVGATVQLSASMEVTWSSSDTNIAGVNDKGLVTGVKEGEATITAKAVKSNAMATCKIIVKAGGVTPPPSVEGISVSDNSIEDWKALPAEKVASCECPSDGLYLGLKGVAVYADELYINILVQYNPEDIPDHTSVPFHVYINTDNSDLTGGYGDQWNDANVDIMMEGFLFSAKEWDGETPLDEGAPCAYDPVIVPWTGEAGGTGWGWGEALVPAGPFVESQHVAGNYVELQMLRELIPSLVGWNESEFGIGFDIQQSWESVGILPLVSPTEENATGHTVKLQVKINK